MERLYEIYQECGFSNKDILEVANNLISLINSPKISKNEDNEIVISFKRGNNKVILLVDKYADIQYIKSTDTDYIYRVYYFSEGIDYNKVIKGS